QPLAIEAEVPNRVPPPSIWWALLGSNPRPRRATPQQIGQQRRAGQRPAGRKTDRSQPLAIEAEVPNRVPPPSIWWALLGSNQ
ncbi:MAG: hypothetical protein QNJ89_15445, partial [Acidimicrobiia bacterium]|nr:hypothetical protein [Acidimicrobiia bacterium]